MTEEFWVLERPTSLNILPKLKEEFAVECNCSSLSIDHVCTFYSPEKAERFDTEEEALKEKRWIGLGFKPMKYRMTLTKCTAELK